MREAAPVGGAISDPVRNTERAIERLHDTEPTIRAWQYVDPDGAILQARVLADDPSASALPLRGVVLGIKDVIDVAGMPTRAGSRAYASRPAAEADAAVVARLRQAGAIVLGKVKTTEFAYTDPTDTANPAAPGHTPGGSSSGSAAAVSAGSADLALGTQTVGSVCRPAAYCGVAAFKPTTGGMPGAGVVPFARSFDTVGFLAREMNLAVQAFAATVGLEAGPAADGDSDRVFAGRTIGIMVDPFYQSCDGETQAALDHSRTLLEAAGAQIRFIASGCDFEGMRTQQRVMMVREAALAHPDLEAHADVLAPNWRGALEQGRRLSDQEYWAARDALAEAKQRLAAATGPADLLLLPPVRTPAPEGLHSTGDAALIVPWTILGNPLAVLPVRGASPQARPTAVMLAGKPWGDMGLARAALALERLLAQARTR